MEDHTYTKDESMVMYASWFVCLRALKPKLCGVAMDALFAYSLLGESFEDKNLPAYVKATLMTFVPVIDANRRRRQGGAKGAQFGALGGRSKTPQGLSSETPKGSRETGNGTATTDTETVTDVVTGNNATTHTDFDFFVPVFFCRNLRNPRRQAEKFVAHYETTGWTLSGGEHLATDEQRVAAAKRWKVTDDPADRFVQPDLDFLGRLLSAAPQDIRISLANSAVDIHRAETLENKEVIKKLILRVPADVKAWMMSDGTVHPIVNEWKGDNVLSIIAL